MAGGDSEVSIGITGDSSSFNDAASQAKQSGETSFNQIRMSAAELRAELARTGESFTVLSRSTREGLSASQQLSNVYSQVAASARATATAVSTIDPRTLLGLSTEFRSASTSAQVFESVLGVVGERTNTLRTLMSGNANEMYTYALSNKSAAESANVFMQALGITKQNADVLTAQLRELNAEIRSSTSVTSSMVDSMLGIGSAAKSAAESAGVFEDVLGISKQRAADLATQVRQLNAEEGRTSQVSRELIDAVTGVSNETKSAAESASVFEKELGITRQRMEDTRRTFLDLNTATTTQKTLLRDEIDALLGVGQSAKSAKDSMDVFTRAAGIQPEHVQILRDWKKETDSIASGAMHAIPNVSILTQEFRALVDEIAGGRLHNAVGTATRTFFTLSQTAGVFSLSFIGATGTILGLSAVLGYVAVQAHEARVALHEATIAGAFANLGVGTEHLRELRDNLSSVANISKSTAGEVIGAFAGMSNSSATHIRALSTATIAYAEATKQEMPKAADVLAKAFSDPMHAGEQLINTLPNVTNKERAYYEAARASGSITQTQAAMLEILHSRLTSVAVEVDHQPGLWATFKASLYDAMIAGATSTETLQQMGSATSALAVRVQNLTSLLPAYAAQLRGAGDAMRQVASEAKTFADRFDPTPMKIAAVTGEIAVMEKALKEATDPKDVAHLTDAIKHAHEELRTLSDQRVGSTYAQQAALEIAQLGATFKGYASERLQAERDIIARELQEEGLTAARKITIQQDLANKDKEIRDAKYHERIAAIEVEAHADKKGSDQNIASLRRELEVARETYGERSMEYLRLQKQIESAMLSGASRSSQVARAVAQDTRGADKAAFDAQAESIKELARLHQISYQEEYARLLQVEMARYDAERKYYATKIDSQAALERAAQEHTKRMVQIENGALTQIAAQYKQTFTQISSTMASSITGMITGTTTFRQAIANVLTQIIQSFIAARLKMVAEWAAGEVAKASLHTATETGMTATTVAANTARTASNTAADAAAAASKSGSMLAQVFASAGETFAGVFGFLAPVMGPAAAGPAAASQATVISVGTAAIPAMDIGAWNIPEDMLAMVHKNELVMPAREASAFRQQLSNVEANPTRPPDMFNLTLNSSGNKSRHELARDANILINEILLAKRRGDIRGRGVL